MNNLGLGFVFTVRDLATSRIQRLERTFHSLDRRVGIGAARIDHAFSRMAAGVGVFTMGAVAIGGAFALATAAGHFETTIAQVAAVSGASAAELDQLSDAALRAGIATQFSPTEAAAGLRELAQVGFGARDSMEMLIPVLDLAAASMGQLSPEQAAGLAAQTLHAFGLEVDQTARSVDQLMQAANLFALDAGELAMGLGTASRGAQAMHQSLGETLATLGLVKNVIPGIERASTTTAVAMERMADPRTQRALRGVGVEVVENGQFRSFLDVLQELGPALAQMTEAQRSAFLISTFGRHALGGLQAVMTALASGVRTQTGEMLRGADAVAYLRDQFEHADGAAAMFREHLLATFEGQERLLRGSLETLAILLGRPFAAVFRPMVSAVTSAVNTLIEVLHALPAPAVQAFAALVVGAGAFVALIGGLIASTAAVGVLSLALEAAGLTFGGIAALMLPAIAQALVFAGTVMMLRIAFERNVGGIADFATRAWNQVRTAFEALTQLFTTGELSGAVQRELWRADQSGLRAFVIRIYMLGFRVARFFDGIREGFVHAIDTAAPLLEQFETMASKLGDELSSLFSALTGDASRLPSERYRSFGEAVGDGIGQAFHALIAVTTAAIRVSTGFFQGLRATAEFLRPLWDAIVKVFRSLAGEMGVLGEMGDGAKGAADAMDVLRRIGQLLGESFGLALVALAHDVLQFGATLLVVVRATREAYAHLERFVLDAKSWLVDLAQRASATYDGLVAVVSAVANAAASVVAIALGYIERVGAAITAALGTARSGLAGVLSLVPPELLPAGVEAFVHGEAPAAAATTEATVAAGAPADTVAPMPAVASARARARDTEALTGALASVMTERRRDVGRRREPLAIALQVDGETLARVTADAEDRLATRSFTPVPVF